MIVDKEKLVVVVHQAKFVLDTRRGQLVFHSRHVQMFAGELNNNGTNVVLSHAHVTCK